MAAIKKGVVLSLDKGIAYALPSSLRANSKRARVYKELAPLVPQS